MRPRVKRKSAITHKNPAVITSKKVDYFENADYWYIEDCDYDRNSHKKCHISKSLLGLTHKNSQKRHVSESL